MAGLYLGKELSCLSVLYDIYGIEERKVVTFFLMRLISLQTDFVNKKFQQQRKKEERLAKAKNGR